MDRLNRRFAGAAPLRNGARPLAAGLALATGLGLCLLRARPLVLLVLQGLLVALHGVRPAKVLLVCDQLAAVVLLPAPLARDLGFGRIVVSAIGVPHMLANLV